MVETVFLSLGSNLGDRAANLDRALSVLEERLGKAPEAVSDYIETESWGFDAPDFINAVAAFKLEDVDGVKLLGICKDIEKEMGRDEALEYGNDGRRIYHSRVIDIDILLIGERTIDLENLKVPHPLMEQRDFVMIPLRQVQNMLNN